MPAAAPLLGQVALNLAIGVGASVLSSALRPSTPDPVTRSGATRSARRVKQKLEVGGEDVPVSAIVGTAPTAGHLIYINQFGAAEQFTQLVVMIGHGEHDGLEALYVDDKLMTLSGSNGDARGRVVEEFKTGSGTPCMWIKTYTGAAGQTADAELVAQASPSSRWTAAHKLTGIAYHVITLRTGNAGIFDSRLPEFRFVWRGLKLYDWRLDDTQPGGEGDHRWADPATREWTDNAAVIRWNYRRGMFIGGVKVLGLGVAEVFNDLTYYTAAANICDETVTDPDTETEYARYVYNREIGDDEEYLSILTELDEAMCGRSFSRGGADAPVPAQTLMAVMTLYDADRMDGEPIRLNKYGSVSTKSTRWHGTFTNAARKYNSTPYAARTNASLESQIGRYDVEFNQPFELLSERAQMRAEIKKRREQFPAVRQETFGPAAQVLEPGDLITRECDWGEVTMQVIEAHRLPGNLGVALILEEWDNAIVPASDESFVDIEAVEGDDAAALTTTIEVTGLEAAAIQLTAPSGAEEPYLKFTWGAISDANVAQVMVRIWPSSGNEADDGEDFFAAAVLNNQRIVGPVSPATQYTFKAIPIRNDLLSGTWTSEDTVTSGGQVIVEDALPAGLIARRDDVEAQIQSLLEQLELLADTTAREASESYQLVSRLGSSLAAVVKLTTVLTGDDLATAEDLTLVQAQVNNVTASGLFGVTSTVDEGEGEVLITLAARVVSGDTVVGAGIGVGVSGGEGFAFIDASKTVMSGQMVSANGARLIDWDTGFDSITDVS